MSEMNIKQTIQSACNEVLSYVHEAMPQGAVFEDTVLENSNNGVKSSGIYSWTKAITGTPDTGKTIQQEVEEIQLSLGNEITSRSSSDSLLSGRISTNTNDISVLNTLTSGIESRVSTNESSISSLSSNKQDKLTQGNGILLSGSYIATDLGSVSQGVTKPVSGGDVYTAIGNASANITEGNGITVSTSGNNKTLSTNITYSSPLIKTNAQSGTNYTVSIDKDNVPTQNSTKMLDSGTIYNALNDKQGTLTQGNGITISSNTISANLEQGYGISITNNNGAKKISAVLPTENPNVDNVLWLSI